MTQMKELLYLSHKDKIEFYQSKYDYYRTFNIYGLGVSCFAFIILFVTDMNDFNYHAVYSLLIRSLVLLPFFAIIIADKKIRDYRIMSIISYTTVHSIIGTSIWVTLESPDQSSATANFLFMGFILLIVSFCAPPSYTIISHWILIAEIFWTGSSHQFNNFYLILTYNLQVMIMLNLVSIIVTKLYYKNYKNGKKLDFLTFHDPLTQVYNRNKLEILTGENHDLLFIPGNSCILVMDIDFFKSVNDTYGHDKGDEVLKSVAGTIKKNLRCNDYVIRWGGEEFLVILPDCNLDAAYQISERIRNDIFTSDNGICHITVSIGVALYEGGNYCDTIKMADEALYTAKENGRNQVKIAKVKFNCK